MKRSFDIWMFISTVGLAIFSLFTILGTKKDLFGNQLIFFFFGYGLLFVFYFLGLSFLFLLILTFIFGSLVRGSRRWIDLYFFQFQPSEFFKVFFLIFICEVFSKKRPGSVHQWWKYFLLFLIPTLIIFKQPDLGNALIYTSAFFGLLYLAGFSIRNFLSISAISLICLPIFC